MKKILAVGALVLTIGAGSLIAHADTAKVPNIFPSNRNANFSIENRDTWFKERTEFKKDEIKRALENGLITEAESKEWEEHFNYMEEFHNENEFMPGGYGGCGGNGLGIGRGMGMMGGRGFGNGMMRGNSGGRY